MLAVDEKPTRHSADTTRAWPVLLLLVVVGFVLRAWGLTFGLPFAYHVDEALFNNVARFADESGFKVLPPSFSVLQLLVVVEHRLLTLVEPAVRALPLSPEIVATLDSTAERYNLVARLHSAVLGAATIVPLYLLGARLWNRRVGLLAAAFMATCYIHVRDSHFGVPEATVCFFTVLAAYFCTLLYAGAPLRRYLLAGLFSGLAVASKQLAWPIFVVLFLFHAFAPPPAGQPVPERSRARAWIDRVFGWKLWAAALTGVVTYLACVPAMVLNWPEFSAYWKAVRNVGARGGMDRLQLEDTGALGTYLYSLRWGMGDVLLVLAVVGLVMGFVKPASPRVRLMFVFPVLYFAFLLLPGHMFYARYTMSGVPFLLLAAAALLWTVMSRLPLPARWRPAAWAAAIALAVAQPLVASIRHDVLLTRTDTRTLAKAWIEDNIPEGSAIMLEFPWFSPPLASAEQPVPFSKRTYRLMSRGAYGLSEISSSFGPSQGTPSIEGYAALGVDYIVSNSYSRGSKLLDPEEDRAKRAFYEELDAEAELVKEISPFLPNQTVPRTFTETYGPAILLSRYERPGPELRIYRVRRPPGLP